jgi:hypothetical protein
MKISEFRERLIFYKMKSKPNRMKFGSHHLQGKTNEEFIFNNNKKEKHLFFTIS